MLNISFHCFDTVRELYITLLSEFKNISVKISGVFKERLILVYYLKQKQLLIIYLLYRLLLLFLKIVYIGILEYIIVYIIIIFITKIYWAWS